MRTTALRHAAPILLLAGVLAACSSLDTVGRIGRRARRFGGARSDGHHRRRGVGRSREGRGVTDIVRKAMDDYKLKAVIYRVTIDGKNVMTDAFGESMTGVPATPDMHFRNGSVAESYIANLLLQLVEEKKVSLDDKISNVVARPPPRRRGLAWQPHQHDLGIPRLRP